MGRRTRRAPSGQAHIWPGFTDAMAGLVVVLVFLLVLFLLFEVVLSRQVGSQEETIAALRGQVERLAELLGTAEDRGDALAEELAASRDKRSRLAQRLDEQRQRAEALEQELAATQEARREARAKLAEVREQRARTEGALAASRTEARAAAANLEALAAHVEKLNQRLERLERALQVEERERVAAESRVEALRQRAAAQEGRIEAMAARIQTELLRRVEELERYRSEFFGRLREVFADRPAIKIRGDRFVFQSEILFPSGEAELSPGGARQLDRFVATYRKVRDRIPEGMDMIIMVEGHTDRVPIRTPRFRSNWELSSARALSVLRHLAEQGIAPRRLAATGYGEYHPVTPGDTPEQRRQNRRIELKITRY